MRPTKLTMQGFMPYAQETTLDLSNIHLACLAGENGHGKSAIIDAITWCVWGKARARRDDELIHLGRDSMSVSLEFLLADTTYRVVRQRDSSGRGSSALEFQLLGADGRFRPLSGDSIRETQQKIIDTLRMDHETFINSALLLQGRADEFTNQPPGERKRILGEILGLGLYDELEDRAKERARAAEMELAQIQAGARQIEEELARRPEYETELEEAQTALGQYERELGDAKQRVNELQGKAAELSGKQEAVSALDRELARARGELKALEERISRVDETAVEGCEKAIADVRGHLAELTGLDDQRSGWEEKARDLATEKAGLSATNEGLRAEMDALKEELELLERAEATCPLCGSDLSDEHRQEIAAEKRHQGKAKADAYRENSVVIREDESEMAACQSELSQISQKVAREKSLRAREAELAADLARLQAERERLGEWQERSQELGASIGDCLARREALAQELKEAEALALALQEARAHADQADAAASRARLVVGGAQQKLHHCRLIEEQREAKAQDYEAAGRQKALYDELRLAFGRRGIQAMIIETVLPEVEQQANDLLQRMTDGRMHVTFDTQRETKAGSLMETLDIQVSDELGTRNYDLFSGGEAFRINFAIRIAISKLLAQRAGARLETLIMDEGFGSQDSRGRDRLVDAINSVQDDFSLVLVITHIDELREAFPDRIEVSKGPMGSTISVN